jgi:hypothetical protein
VADKHIVFNRDAFADKSVTGDLAILSDRRVFLYFNKRSDFRVVSNFAPVQIDKF